MQIFLLLLNNNEWLRNMLPNATLRHALRVQAGLWSALCRSEMKAEISGPTKRMSTALAPAWVRQTTFMPEPSRGNLQEFRWRNDLGRQI